MTKIIAELSNNFGGDLCKCLHMIKAAKWCGCWAVKFQYYQPEDLPDFDAAVNFPIPHWWLPEMNMVANGIGIPIFASVFSAEAAAFIAREYDRVKIASPESTRLPPARYLDISAAIHEKAQVIVSSGKQDFWEMKRRFPRAEMLYCKAGYPATIDIDDVKFMAANAVGFSDHTAGIMDSLVMYGAGAQYIEKHFKLDDNCVDAAFSLNPDEMKTLCEVTK